MTSANVEVTNTAVLLIAIEVSEKKWHLGFSRGGTKVRRRSVDAWDTFKFGIEVAKAKKNLGLDPSCPVIICYEAGRSGFSIHRYMTKNGFQSEIMDSSSIEVNRRSKKAKTDRLDVLKMTVLLVRKHINGEQDVYRTVHVPSESEESEMRLHRERGRLKKEATAHRTRIKALLALHGVSQVKINTLDPSKVKNCMGEPLPLPYREEIEHELKRLDLAEERIKELEKKQNKSLKDPKTRSEEIAALLIRLKAVGPQSAWILSHEMFGWRHFSNRKQVGAFSGLVDMPFNSGSSCHQQGISKSGNKRVRWVIIELAWSWLRYQPQSALSIWFFKRFSGNKRQRRVGIVALARKLLIALWKYVEHGELPEGAKPKAA